MKDKRRTTDVKAVFLGVKNDSSDRGFITGSIQIVKDPSGKYKQSQAVNLFLTVEDDLPEAGYCYTFRGKHEEFNGKPNFKASEFLAASPVGKSAVVKYLAKVGEGSGVGNAYALKYYDEYGSEVLAKLAESHLNFFVDGIRITDLQAKAIQAKLQQNIKQQEAEILLFDLLDGYKLPRGTIAKCMKQFGLNAAEIIRRNPFHLLKFHGIGVKTCDKLFLDLGGDPASRKRAIYVGQHELTNSQCGSTWFLPSRMKKAMVGLTSIERKAAIAIGIKAGLISKFRDSSGQWFLADRIRAENEWRIAVKIAELSKATNRWDKVVPIIEDSDLSDHQKEEVKKALHGRIVLLSGSPGTGKTFTAARIIKAFQSKVGSVGAMAPTGKASVRLTESFQSNGLKLTASTIHSALFQVIDGEKISPTATVGGEWNHDLVVIDEASMLNTDLFRLVIDGLNPGACLLLIGDENQLPPIEHGAPFRDLLKVLPAGEFTEIRRNAGDIVKACHRMKDGKEVAFSKVADQTEEKNLIGLPCPDEKIESVCIESIRNIEEEGFDPVWDCQILTATNKSRKELNQKLQVELNQNSAEKGSIFRYGDKVINLQNETYQEAIQSGPNWWNYDTGVYVANGEIGKVVDCQPRRIVVQVGEKHVFVPKGISDTEPLCNWDLAYAITIHKSQGSQAPFAFVVIGQDGGKLFCRELIYTAISRAEKACYVVGKVSKFNRIAKEIRLNERKTFLAERIKSRIKQEDCETEREFGKVFEK